jgi:hypothetical protein
MAVLFFSGCASVPRENTASSDQAGRVASPPEEKTRIDAPSAREQEVKALAFKGLVLGRAGKFVEAIAVFDGIDRRFGKDDTPRVREEVARALGNKGVTLGEQGKSVEAIAVYDEIDRRFGQDDTPGVRQWVAKALVDKNGIKGQ